MFSGFNLQISKGFDEYYYEYGKKVYEEVKVKTRKRLDEYVNSNGRLDGSRLKEDWFPQIDVDIFLSHSHSDEKLAIGLAGWLNKEFGVNVFIDSCIWGYCDDLLRDINEEYSKVGEDLYNYSHCNHASSHVHMMLSAALNQMIDKAECTFLLNTPNSIDKVEETILKKTRSPWIYSEIIMTQLVRKRNLTDYRKSIMLEKSDGTKDQYFSKLEVDYDVTLDHLYDLDETILNKWKVKYSTDELRVKPLYVYEEKHTMDYLYDVVGIKYKKKENELVTSH